MKVRVKKRPQPGDQAENFSLVTGKEYNHNVEPDASKSGVKGTLKAVPREEANIEAEHGETVYGDVNNDGYLEHFKISGKKHSQGGVPLNVGEGSFVFSDAKNMSIKDEEVLKYFMKRKGKYTPADIAKQYDINSYIADLKNEDSDSIDKNTADLMVKNNANKLSKLAMLQESMKGFPTGVPAAAQIGVFQDEEPQMMKYGGKVTIEMYEEGGTKKKDPMQSTFTRDPKTGFYESPLQREMRLQRLRAAQEKLAKQQLEREAAKNVLLDPRLTPLQGNNNGRPEYVVPGTGQETSPAQTRTRQSTSPIPLPESLKPYEKYFKWDEATRKHRLQIPSDVPVSEKLDIAEALTSSGFKGVIQSGNSRTQTGYNDFYGGLNPADFERAYVENQVSPEEYAKMSEIDIRRKFLTDFKVGDSYTDEQLKNPKNIYNNKAFMKTLYGNFKEKFPAADFRVLGDDAKFGFDHLEVMGARKKNEPIVVDNTTVKDGKDKEKPQNPAGQQTGATDTSTDAEEEGASGKWWTPDIANLAVSLTDKVNKYDPVLYQAPIVQQDATLVDPSRGIAAQQEQFNVFADATNNASEGQVARANLLAASGEAGSKIADVIGQTQNANAQISNATSAQNAQMMQQGMLTNTQLRKSFQDESATGNQNYDNAKRALKQRQLNAWVQGTSNSMRTDWLNRMIKEFNAKPQDGSINFTGKTDGGYDPDGIGVNNGSGSTAQTPDYMGEYAKLYNEALEKTNGDKTAANSMAKAVMEQRLGKNSQDQLPYRKPTLNSRMQEFMMMSGMMGLGPQQQHATAIPPWMMPTMFNPEG